MEPTLERIMHAIGSHKYAVLAPEVDIEQYDRFREAGLKTVDSFASQPLALERPLQVIADAKAYDHPAYHAAQLLGMTERILTLERNGIDMIDTNRPVLDALLDAYEKRADLPELKNTLVKVLREEVTWYTGKLHNARENAAATRKTRQLPRISYLKKLQSAVERMQRITDETYPLTAEIKKVITFAETERDALDKDTGKFFKPTTS